MSATESHAVFLEHPLLSRWGVEHGFGVRGCEAPPRLQRPRQVHGAEVVELGTRGGLRSSGEADAIVSARAHVPVGVVTADCVPILIAAQSGAVVAAVHAGWRGLARGVIAAAVAALRARGGEPERGVAVVGPHIGAGCYEVDRAVTDPLEERFGAALERAIAPTRAGHWNLSLGTLVRIELLAQGFRESGLGAIEDACTACDGRRFASYRRDGPDCGRLIHFIAASRHT